MRPGGSLVVPFRRGTLTSVAVCGVDMSHLVWIAHSGARVLLQSAKLSKLWRADWPRVRATGEQKASEEVTNV